MFSHKQMWDAIDALAARNGLSTSGLAKRAGLDATTFNKSKRLSSAGHMRWPTTESLSRILDATRTPFHDFVLLVNGRSERPAESIPLIGFAKAGEAGLFDESGAPTGTGWEQIAFPKVNDASAFDPEGRLPEIPETNASKSGRERAVALARRENLSVRQLAQRLGGYAGLAFVGTPKTIADAMEEWLVAEGSDGFNVMFPYLPAGLDDFAEKVVPELQRRGIFRRQYEGTTLRENLGLKRPPNRFFDGEAARKAG